MTEENILSQQREFLEQFIEDNSPRPGPNYYSFNQHRVIAESGPMVYLVNLAKKRLEELGA